MSATTEQDFQTQQNIPQAATSKMGIVPLNSVVVVDRKHPLAEKFFTPRNTYKPDAAMVNSIKANNGPDYAPKVFQWKDDEGNVKLIVIDGNQRVLAAKEAGLEKIKVDVQNISLEDAARLATRANSQRKDNTFATNAILAMRMLKPNKETGKLEGLSYEQAASEFGKTHTWVRDIVKAWTRLPQNIKQDIEKGKISFTLVKNALLKDELLNDAEALQAKYKEILGDGGPVENTSGKAGRSPRPSSSGATNSMLKISKNVWQLIARHKDTPEHESALIQTFIGEKSIQQARSEFPDELSWLVEPSTEAKEAAKGKGKGKKGKAKKEGGEIVASSSSPTVNEPTSDIDMDLFS